MSGPFSNATEGDMFTHSWCRHCRFAVDGEMCDDVLLSAMLGEWPDALTRVEPNSYYPLGLICNKIEPRDDG